jgi:hypothetical protein
MTFDLFFPENEQKTCHHHGLKQKSLNEGGKQALISEGVLNHVV